MKKYILYLLCSFLMLVNTAYASTSTINPVLPATGQPLSSSVLRGNYQAAYNDINNIYGQIAALNSAISGLPTFDPSNVAITGGTISGVTISLTNGTKLLVGGNPLATVAYTGAYSDLIGKLVIGTDVQAYHSNLTALSSVTAAADKCPYFSGASTAAVFTCSSYGRTLAASADAAAVKTSLSLGNVENTALSTWAGSTNITTLGTIATGDWAGTKIPVNKGGTNLTSGTSGGILGYTASGTLASSGALTANALVLGGGAGATPSALGSLGTTTTLLHGNAGGAPTFGAVSLTADVSGDLPYSSLAQVGANTVLANPTTGTADVSTVALSASNLLGRGSTGNVAAITLGTNLSMSGGQLNAVGGGAGDIIGPASATDNAIVRYDGTTGKLVQNSGASVDDSSNLTATTLNLTAATNQIVLDSDGTFNGTINMNTLSNNRAWRFPDAGGDVALLDATQTFTNKTFDSTNIFTIRDDRLTLQDNGDATKQVQFQASGITTGNTRTLTVPDASTTIAGTDATQTLTNKTINGSNNTITNVSLATGVTGNLPVTNLNTGTSASSSTFWRGDGTWATPAGSGNVSAALNITDNRIVRGDGGTTGIQESGITIDDSNNVTGIAELTLPNTGLHLLDTNASHDLILAPGSDITADRTLTITTGDASRTLTMSGNATISGTNTGDQTSVSGNAGTATALATARAIGGVNFDGTADITPTQIQPAAENSDTTNFLAYFNSASGTAQQPKYNASLGYNASTNALSATTFSGALSGNASTATALATARAIGNVNFDGTAAITPEQTVIVDSSDATSFLLMTDSVTGNLQHKTDPTITANPTNGTIAATTFSGALSGNASTATALATARAIGGVNFDGTANIVPQTIQMVDAAGDTTTFPLLATSATGSLQPATDAGLSYNATTDVLTSTGFALPSGGAISFDAGDSTITDGTDILAFSGAGAGYTFASGPVIINDTAARTLGNAVAANFEQFGTTAATGSQALGMFNATAGTQAEMQFYRSKNAALATSTVVASGDGLGKLTWYGAQQTGTLATVSSAAQIRAEVDGTVTSGAGGDMPGRLIFSTTPDASATLTDRLILDAAGILKPNANDGVALGTGALSFSDLFLASGGVLNWNNADVTETHSADTLTFAGASTGYVFNTGLLTANANLTVGNGATTAGTLKLLEDTDNGSNFASFAVPALAADTVYTLPTTDGNASEFLQTDGSGTLTWAADSNNWTKICAVTASASATVSFVNGTGGCVISSTYKVYMIAWSDVIPATDNTTLTLKSSTNAGVSYDGAASDYATTGMTVLNAGGLTGIGASGTTRLLLNENIGNAAGESGSGRIFIYHPSSTSFTGFEYTAQTVDAAASGARIDLGAGHRSAAADVDAVQFAMTSGNITSGLFTLYGLTP